MGFGRSNLTFVNTCFMTQSVFYFNKYSMYIWERMCIFCTCLVQWYIMHTGKFVNCAAQIFYISTKLFEKNVLKSLWWSWICLFLFLFICFHFYVFESMTLGAHRFNIVISSCWIVPWSLWNDPFYV